jgi:hypothetical protein
MPKFIYSLQDGSIEMRVVTKSKLIAWVTTTAAGQAAFSENFGPDNKRTVEEYLRQYSYRKDIVSGLAEDLSYPGD